MLIKRKTISKKVALKTLEQMSNIYDIISVSVETKTEKVEDFTGLTIGCEVIEKTLSFVLRPK